MRADEAVELLGGIVRGDGFKAGVALALRAQGWGQEEIGRELVLGQSTVSRWLQSVRAYTGVDGGLDVLEAALVVYGSWMDRGPP